MQVTSLLSRQEPDDHHPEHDHEHHDHDHHHDHHHDHEHAPVRLVQTLIGVVFVINAYLVDWLFEQGHTVASASAMVGAIILGYPMVWTAVKDL